VKEGKERHSFHGTSNLAHLWYVIVSSISILALFVSPSSGRKEKLG